MPSGQSNINFGVHPDFVAVTGTAGGNPAMLRSIMTFDLSSIPVNSTITSANLSLFFHMSPSNGSSHNMTGGSNACYLQRVVDPWVESVVTWDDQPGTTTLNQVTIPASTSGTQDYPNIDVTTLIGDMVANNNYGMLMKMVYETSYDWRSLLFASTDEADTNKHPILEVCYKVNSSIDEVQLTPAIQLYPNPAQAQLHLLIENVHSGKCKVDVLNSLGQVVFSDFGINNGNKQTLSIDVSAWPSGIYIIRAANGKQIAKSKFIKQ